MKLTLYIRVFINFNYIYQLVKVQKISYKQNFRRIPTGTVCVNKYKVRLILKNYGFVYDNILFINSVRHIYCLHLNLQIIRNIFIYGCSCGLFSKKITQ